MSVPATASSVPTAFDVAALRQAEFPWADETVYLNHASIGPVMPHATASALFFAARNPLSPAISAMFHPIPARIPRAPGYPGSQK